MTDDWSQDLSFKVGGKQYQLVPILRATADSTRPDVVCVAAGAYLIREKPHTVINVGEDVVT
jgi:hypothetical protein